MIPKLSSWPEQGEVNGLVWVHWGEAGVGEAGGCYQIKKKSLRRQWKYRGWKAFHKNCKTISRVNQFNLASVKDCCLT